MGAASSIPVERVNELIRLFGEHQLREMRAEKREVMKAVLFDLPRRSSLGWHALYEHEADFLRELSEHMSPEELGRRMRFPGSRPYSLQPFIIVCSYLGARQQELLDQGLEPGQPWDGERYEDLAFVMDWWARLSAAFRSDDVLLPGEADYVQPILDQEVIDDVVERLEPVSEERYRVIRRMAATLELYCFVLHGEQRDGITGHGPYPLPDGRTLFFKEFNDLRNTYLPWARTETMNVLDNVVIAHAARDVTVRCDMFGSISITPSEFGDRLTDIAVLTNEGGTLRTVSDDELPAIQEAAASAQEELYIKATQWDDEYKIAYGAPLFANHLKPFFDLAGLTDPSYGERIMRACQQTAERMVPKLAGKPIPSFWGHVGSTDGDLFWPVAR
jgi:hypothetical protein